VQRTRDGKTATLFRMTGKNQNRRLRCSGAGVRCYGRFSPLLCAVPPLLSRNS